MFQLTLLCNKAIVGYIILVFCFRALSRGSLSEGDSVIGLLDTYSVF